MIQGIKFFAAACETSLPLSVLPVKQIKSNLKLVNIFAISTSP
jgi:hypothetical protein